MTRNRSTHGNSCLLPFQTLFLANNISLKFRICKHFNGCINYWWCHIGVPFQRLFEDTLDLPDYRKCLFYISLSTHVHVNIVSYIHLHKCLTVFTDVRLFYLVPEDMNVYCMSLVLIKRSCINCLSWYVLVGPGMSW